jgi:hypothetical protein
MSNANIAELRELIPPHSRAPAGDSMCCPIELGQLLDAAPIDRPLLAFTPPLGGLGAAAAGVLRAAREHAAAVLLRVDLGTSQAAVSSAAFSALAKACDESRYGFPIGLLAQLPASPSTVGSGATARQIADALGAGFPSVFLALPIAAEAEAQGDELIDALATLRERELGWALGLAIGSDSREGQAWLSLLTERVSLPTVVRCAARAGLPGPVRHWRPTRGNEQEDQRERIRAELPALVDVALAMPHGARAERAEAFAYFAAETAFRAWEQEKTAHELSEALRAAWKGEP